MKNTIRRFRSLTISAAAVLIVYLLTTLAPEGGWLTYFVALPAMIITGLTALARVNHIGNELVGRRWDVRRMGFSIVGGVMLMYASGPLYDQFPTWRATILVWGISMVWTTTPGMPPWVPWADDRDDPNVDRSLSGFLKSLFGRS